MVLGRFVSPSSPDWVAFWRGHGTAGEASDALASAIAEALSQARAAYGDLPIPEAAFTEALGRGARDGEDPAAAVRGIAAADLYLATGCALGLTLALRQFEKEQGPRLDTRIEQRAPAAEVPDLRQAIRRKLLVGGQRPPRIAEYRGHGRLAPWLRVVLSRLLVDAHRRRAPTPVAEASLSLAAVEDDPELRYLKSHYGEVVQKAFEESIAALGSRDRVVLRCQIVDGLSADEIAGAYGVHGATVRRWLARARDQLLTDTRARIGRRLSARPDELTSIVRLVRSQLDVSVARLLREADDGPDELP